MPVVGVELGISIIMLGIDAVSLEIFCDSIRFPIPTDTGSFRLLEPLTDVLLQST